MSLVCWWVTSNSTFFLWPVMITDTLSRTFLRLCYRFLPHKRWQYSWWAFLLCLPICSVCLRKCCSYMAATQYNIIYSMRKSEGIYIPSLFFNWVETYRNLYSCSLLTTWYDICEKILDGNFICSCLFVTLKVMKERQVWMIVQ